MKGRFNLALFISRHLIGAKGAENGSISGPIVRIAVIGIALGLAAMICSVAIVRGFQGEIKNKIIGFGAHIQITSLDNHTSDEPLPISEHPEFLKDLQSTPGIQHIQIFAYKTGLIKTKTDNKGILIKGIGPDYNWDFINKNLIAGRVFDTDKDSLIKPIVISEKIANRIGKKVGDKLIVYFITQKQEAIGGYEQRLKEFTITGIYNSGFEEYDKKIVFADIKVIRRLNYWNNQQVGGFELALTDFKQLDAFQEKINDLVGQGYTAQSVKQVNETIFSWLDLQDVNAIIVIVLMVVVAAINMISALLILILERTNMIGILKALGANNWLIQRVFLFNATYLITKGLIWGNIIGIGLCWLQLHFGFLKLPQETYYVPVIPISLKIWPIVLLNLGTLFCCFIMLLLPSLIVSKITPIKSIRFA